MATTTDVQPTNHATSHQPAMTRPARQRRRRTIRLSMLAAVLATLVGGGLLASSSPASAATTVAGVYFGDSSAKCGGLDSLAVVIADNTLLPANSPVRYARILLWDYAAGVWVYGPWHALGSYSVFTSSDFNFGHHGYYYPEIQYAVWTSSGYMYGVSLFKSFTQADAFGGTHISSSCWV
jgi:hypothetical protein